MPRWSRPGVCGNARGVPSKEDLRGFTVGVTADRRAEDQAVMLRRLGVEVVHAPTIRTVPVADAEGLRARTLALIDNPPDYVVANTGLGIRTWLGAAGEWGLDGELRHALSRTRILARGPKAAGAVQIAGLEVWWRSPTEQLADVGDRLVQEGLSGKRVAFQLHGDDRQVLTRRLVAAGAQVIEILVYQWSLPENGQPARRLIDLACRGGLDAVTFTAGPAVRYLLELADAEGRASELLAALNTTVIAACIGPVCASVAEDEGIQSPLTPPHWRLGSLVRTLGEALAARRRRFVAGRTTLTLQGSLALVGDRPVPLTVTERHLLDLLAEHPGSTVAPGAPDAENRPDSSIPPLTWDPVIAGLRAKLGPVGAAIESIDHGYRLQVLPA
jgi:uroporphyrinogen-III synthase